MASFIDNYGLLHPHQNQPIVTDTQTYVIIKKNRQVACEFFPESGLLAFPNISTCSLTETPTIQFDVIARIYKNKTYVEEKQQYLIYDITEEQLENTTLQWCKIEDIMVGLVDFDATQRVGFKNFLVRIK